MKRYLPLLALVALTIIATLFTIVMIQSPAGESPRPAPTPSASDYDPYAYYLEHNPDPSLVLSEQDAGLRATLGCDYPEAQIMANPVDRVLREAYGPTGICG